MNDGPPLVEAWAIALEPLNDVERAGPMQAYMKGHFPFLGIPAPVRRRIARDVWRTFPPADEATLHAVTRTAWARPEREYQYCAVDYLAVSIGACGAATTLPLLEELITTKSWWDTVDGLCRAGAGALVRAEPAARGVMDDWLERDDIWLIRSAILHQERWGEAMDFAWISRAARRHAEHREFFVRKAIGWVLRTYAHRSAANADAVRTLLASAPFSGLTRREALVRVAH